MKKLLLTALLAFALLLPLGTTALAEDETTAESDAVYLYVPGNAPAQTDVSSMLPALHGVLLAMDNQGMTSFTAEENILSWEMLYNLLSMYGQMDSRDSIDAGGTSLG
jgi:hypothetical protein